MPLWCWLYLAIGFIVWLVAYQLEAFLNDDGRRWGGMYLFKTHLSYCLPGAKKRKLAYARKHDLGDDYVQFLPGWRNLLLMSVIPLTWLPVLVFLVITNTLWYLKEK